MATTPLTEAPVPALDYPDLIRRAWAGERVTIHDGIHPDLILTADQPAPHHSAPDAEAPYLPPYYHPDPVIMEQQRQELRRKTLDLGPELTELLAHLKSNPLDPSAEATLERARKLDEERGGLFPPDPEFADLLEEIVASRKPLRAHGWD